MKEIMKYDRNLDDNSGRKALKMVGMEKEIND